MILSLPEEMLMTNKMIACMQYFQGGIVSHIYPGICGYLGWVLTFLIRLSGNSVVWVDNRGSDMIQVIIIQWPKFRL